MVGKIMISDYHNLVRKFRHVLKIFRKKLLFSEFLKGMTVMVISFCLLILCYTVFTSFFQIGLLVKQSFYYLLWFCLGIEFLYWFIFPMIRFSICFKDNYFLKFVQEYLINKQPDVFMSAYHLAFHRERIIGNDDLKKAAFIQKYNYLYENNLMIEYPSRKIFVRFLILIFSCLFCLVFWNFLFGAYNDLRNFDEINYRHELKFEILNENLSVEYGQNFELNVSVGNKNIDVEQVFVCYGGGEFLMNRIGDKFVYEFSVLNNDVSFYLKANDEKSDVYRIKVLPTPLITAYKAIVIPPAYTGLDAVEQFNTIDFKALYGSRFNLDLSLSDVDSLYLCDDLGNISFLPFKKSDDIHVSFIVKKSGEYVLCGSNKYFHNKDLLSFTINCIPDLYPSIRLTSIQDSLHSSVYYFYGVIADDYGFSALNFNYSIHGVKKFLPVNISTGQLTQEFYFTFDFSDFSENENSSIDFYFEVFDNDILSGPKSTRSVIENYLVPDLDAVFSYNVEASQSINSSLNVVEKLSNEIISDIKKLQQKILENGTDDWENQQFSKDIVAKKDKLDKLLKQVKEDNLKKSDLNKSFTQQDSILLEKQKIVQDLLDNVMDTDFENLMKEFSELARKFSKDKFYELENKMKLTFGQLNEKLDQNIELLKRFQIEEHHDLITQQLGRLKSLQREFDNDSVSKDSLSKSVKDGWDHLKDNYKQLLNDNKQLSDPYPLENFESDFDDLSEKIDEQFQNIGSDFDDKKSSEIEKRLDELSDKLDKQKKEQFEKNELPRSDIELMIQNLLIISFSQEDLMREFPKVETKSSRYGELGRLQDLKRQEYKIVKDSLSLLARSNLALAALLNDKFYDLEVKFGLLPDLIQNNKRGDLSREQQYIITYLNDIALSLTTALQQNGNGKDGKESDGKKDGGGKNKGNGGYGKLKQYQQSLKKQLGNLISQMKNGDDNKLFYRNIAEMIRANELFRKGLNDFMSATSSLSNIEKQLLNEINRLLDDNIKDLSNYNISSRLVNRNNQVYTKLLNSEKASRERQEYDDKRKSETARAIEYQRPQTIFDMRRTSKMLKTDFQKYDLKLNDFYKKLYNDYYLKLGNE